MQVTVARRHQNLNRDVRGHTRLQPPVCGNGGGPCSPVTDGEADRGVVGRHVLKPQFQLGFDGFANRYSRPAVVSGDPRAQFARHRIGPAQPLPFAQAIGHWRPRGGTVRFCA